MSDAPTEPFCVIIELCLGDFYEILFITYLDSDASREALGCQTLRLSSYVRLSYWQKAAFYKFSKFFRSDISWSLTWTLHVKISLLIRLKPCENPTSSIGTHAIELFK